MFWTCVLGAQGSTSKVFNFLCNTSKDDPASFVLCVKLMQQSMRGESCKVGSQQWKGCLDLAGCPVPSSAFSEVYLCQCQPEPRPAACLTDKQPPEGGKHVRKSRALCKAPFSRCPCVMSVLRGTVFCGVPGLLMVERPAAAGRLSD